MRTGDTTGLSDEPDDLTARHRVTFGDERLAHVEVAGHDPSPVIEVHHGSRQIERLDQSDNAAIRRLDRIANRSSEVDAQMAAGHRAVEHSACPKRARDE